MGERLTDEQIGGISNWGERTFAKACSSRKNLEVEYQVPVGKKVIDFRVTNKRVGGDGTLVEVTVNTPQKVDKSDQIRAMEESGSRHTVLYVSNLKKVRDGLTED